MKWIGNFDMSLADITSVIAGTGLSGGGTTGAVTLNVDASQTQITGLGTITTGVWNGDVIASAYLDADTAHLSGTQTFTGTKTFDGDKDITPGDGSVIHIDEHNVTDTNTSASGTAAMYTHVNIEAPRLLATNASVTTTNAASLYIKAAPTAHTNQTITNAYSLWVDDGLVQFDGNLRVSGTITGTLGATAQPNIESIGTDGDTLNILADQLHMSSATTDMPTIKLTNTTDGIGQSELILEKLRDDDDVSSGQNLGSIWFRGQDSGQNTEDYAYIVGEIDVSTHSQESGKLTLGVANHDGGNGSGLILTGGSEDNEIDATIGLGANSVVTIPGNIDLAGDVDIDGTLETDALTVGGVAFTPSTTKHVTHHTIKDDIGTGVIYISLGEIDAESGTKSNKNLPILAPVAGKLLKVFLRTAEDMSASGHDTNLTWRLLTRTTSVTTDGNAAVIGTQTGAGPTASSMATYDFTSSLDSGTNVIAAGDKVQLSVQSDAASEDMLFFITCLWEWDFS